MVIWSGTLDLGDGAVKATATSITGVKVALPRD